MVLTNSSMPELGTKIPEFNLPNVLGRATVSQNDLPTHKGILVAFICNHCPYVVHIIDKLTEHFNRYVEMDLGVACISANDIDTYAADSPEKMAVLAKNKGFKFPYLYDETQNIAKAFKAECTPDFFLYNANKELVYRGQFDASRPGNNDAVTGIDLDQAVAGLVGGTPIPINQTPSIGCNIKWK